MNKKILLSMAAAAVAMTITGCGSDDTTALIPTSGATTNSSGFTTIGGTTVGASKGALSGSTVTQSGTRFTATGGTDTISGDAFTGSIQSDSALTDSEGRVIANTFTNLAIASGEDNVTEALNTVATRLGSSAAALTKVFQATAADAALENISRLLQRQYEANPTAVTNIIKFGGATTPTALLNAINTETEEVNATVFADMVANINLNPTQFANTLAALDANASLDFNTTATANAITYSGIALDSNATTAGSFTSGTFTTSMLNDSNLSTATAYGDANETGEILLSIRNLEEDSINSNASYALKLSNLTVNSASNYITSLSVNANTTLALTANSNMSVAATFNESNMTQIINFVGSSDFNGTYDVSNIISSLAPLVGTELDTADSNFTSGMEANSTFGVKLLMNVNDINFTTSDQSWLIEKDSINIGADTGDATYGTGYAGYKVLDGNLTK